MNQSDAFPAARQEKQNDMVLVATVTAARCILQYVPSAERKRKCLSNREVINRYIAAIAIAKSEIDNIG
jgi:hypothetical protein